MANNEGLTLRFPTLSQKEAKGHPCLCKLGGGILGD
jgi:hypothetical protein